eukprot:TRINITY_DN2846_c0_g1_i2.p1 TRINITY_DN2846_c0_g1~~TRINITY_DN2846_c0_g1_i2.p1  ORF type:complete len:156 (+),score=42.13 TRINITY_DN2846_c0_g1_i2:79-546(+)
MVDYIIGNKQVPGLIRNEERLRLTTLTPELRRELRSQEKGARHELVLPPRDPDQQFDWIDPRVLLGEWDPEDSSEESFDSLSAESSSDEALLTKKRGKGKARGKNANVLSFSQEKKEKRTLFKTVKNMRPSKQEVRMTPRERARLRAAQRRAGKR